MTKTFKQIREIDVPKGHEYGPSSRKRPAGKAGYTSSDSARTTHLKTVKKWSKKKRRQGDKEFANESPEHPRNIRFGDSRAKQVAIDTIKNPNKSLLGGPTSAEAEKVLKVKFGYTDAQIKKLQEANWSISPEKQKEVNKFLAKSTGGSMHQDVNLVMKKFGLSKSKAQDMVFNWMSSWSPDKRLSAWGPKDMPEEVKEDWQDTGKWKGRARLRQTQANFAVLGDGKVLSTHGAESTAKKQADGFKKSGRWKNIKIVAKEEVKEAYKKGDSSITFSFKNSIERAHFKSWLKKEKDIEIDFNWSDEGRTDLEIGHIQPDFDIIKYAKKSKIQFTSEESPANATGSAVAGTGDDSSTVLVKKRKELQKRLLRRFSIKETLDKILPDPVEKEDELTTRKNQLKELAKNRNV